MKDKIYAKGFALVALLAAGIAGLAGVSGCKPGSDTAEDTATQHIGTFVNRTGQNATDLDLEFDVEGVEYDGAKKNPMDKWEPDKDNKKIIRLDGKVNIGGSAFGQKFKRKDGEFNIKHWWWTQIDPETKEHKQIGNKMDGPPAGEDGEWK